MRVYKFGGTSLGSAERMHQAAEIINDGQPKIVVLSAMSGTTNILTSLCHELQNSNHNQYLKEVQSLRVQYTQVMNSFNFTEKTKCKAENLINDIFIFLESCINRSFDYNISAQIVAKGELLSTHLFLYLLLDKNINATIIPALSFMRIDKDSEPDIYYLKENIHRELEKNPGCSLFITQGFICRDVKGNISNLGRGGSDYSATLIGSAVGAEEIQIWTDIDGVHNNDPRFVENTQPIEKLSFDEAAELAYFGAKILHPTSMLPAKESNIPVLLKNTLEPKATGTRISDQVEGQGVKAVAAKDGITSIIIHSGRMLMAYGFLRRVFEIFERYKTPIDMITTSEVGIALTIDDTSRLELILEDLKELATVKVYPDQTIISVVGQMETETKGIANRIFEALNDIPLRMISYGASDNNISFLIKTSEKKVALESLSNHLF
ncbi:MAG: aspartate kinase [Bacteroidales bacterium]|nr:aspartate kinase [Bacteroidales bacterium]